MSGWSYRCHWWISHDDHGVFAARVIHGQALHVDPAAEMVITRFASQPRVEMPTSTRRRCRHIARLRGI